MIWPAIGLLLALALAAFIVWLMSDREDSMTVTADVEPFVWNQESYDNGDYV